MNLATLILILVSVITSAIAQALLKAGVSKPHGEGRAVVSFPFDFLDLLSRPAIVGGFLLYGLGAFLWLGALSRTELSRAYPFVSLGFVLTTLIGYFLFDEAIGPMRLGGIALIMFGVFLVAAS